MKRAATVFVVNNSGEDFADQFDGEKFVFPASKGVAVEIPVAAAQLIFGVGDESKLRCVQRLGWAATSNDMEKAIKRLGQFSFHAELPKGHSTAPVESAEGAIDSQEPEAPGSLTEQSIEAAPVAAPKSLLGKLAAAATARPG